MLIQQAFFVLKNYLQQGKITLRPPEPGDLELLYLWENDMELWELSNTKAPFSRHLLAEYLKNAAKDIYETKQLRLIIENEAKRAVGAIDLFDFDPFHLRAGVGILIHNKGDRNQGYASGALAALSNYSLHVLGLKQLYANIAEDNAQSLRLFEKAGFRPAGRKEKWLKTPGGWKDELFLQKVLH